MKIHKFISLAVLGILLLNLSVLAGAQDPLEEIKLKIEIAACWILSILVVIVGLVAALFIVLSGIKWMTSEDLAERNEAKNRIMWAIIGFLVVILACPFAEFLAFEPLKSGFCVRCQDITEVPLGPTPPGEASGGDPGGPKVRLIAEPPRAEPGDTIKFTCKAEDPDGLDSPAAGFLVEESAGLFGPIGFVTSGNPKSATLEHSETINTAGQWSVICSVFDLGGDEGWARISVTISDSTSPVAVIDSIARKSLAELKGDPDVERSLKMEIYVRGHMEGGTGASNCVWTVGAATLNACEGWIKADPIGPKTATFEVQGGGGGKTTSVYINVIETTEDAECELPEDCEATDTDGGNKPEKKGICYEMKCTELGACVEDTDYPDNCHYSINLDEYYPTNNDCEEEEDINCYEHCGDRGGICKNDECQCFGDNCIMKPKSQFSGYITLEGGGLCRLRDAKIYVSGGKGFVEDEVGTTEFYRKVGTTPCNLPGGSLWVLESGHHNSKPQQCTCTGVYAGKCTITITYYKDVASKEYFSVCLEDTT